LYWLTRVGTACQRRLRQAKGLAPIGHELPEIDWGVYAGVCYRHRGAVIKAMAEAMQPAAIKRRARFQNPQLRMSANNVRDVIRQFLAKGVVQQVRIKQRAYPRYVLTELGKQCQGLLVGAEVPA
jgi:hypothetical protein